MNEKVKKVINEKKKIILIGIGIVVSFGVIGGGYYWWIGTPEYSINQIKKAIGTNNSELGLKFIDTDAIFENLWTNTKGEIVGKTSEAEGFEALGMMLGLQIIENMKPALKGQVEEGIKSWFLASTEKENSIWQEKDLEVKKQGDSAYIELSDSVKIVFTK